MIEFFKQPGVYEVLIFCMGVFTYKLASYVFKYRELYSLSLTTVEMCIKMVSLVYYNIKSSSDFSEKKEGDAGEDMKILRNEYAQFNKALDNWYESALRHIQENIPKEFNIEVTKTNKR